MNTHLLSLNFSTNACIDLKDDRSSCMKTTFMLPVSFCISLATARPSVSFRQARMTRAPAKATQYYSSVSTGIT